MADYPMDGQVHSPAPVNFGMMANLAGAVASVAIVVGVGVWGYKILARDVSGVPVVRAAAGPMRVLPKDPGGRPAAHQGLAVNAVAATGTAEKPADQWTLAPAPIELNDQDQPMPITVPKANSETPIDVSAQAAPAPIAPKPAAPVGTPTVQTAAVQTPATPAPTVSAPAPNITPEMDPNSIEALAAQIALSAAPLGHVAPKPNIAPPVVNASVEPPKPAALKPAEPAAPTSGLRRSLRPKARPAGFAQRVAAPAPAAPTRAAFAAPDIAPGTRLVQLGAYASPEIARAEWDKLIKRFPTYLGEKTPVVQRATSGGRIFYRLRALGGFSEIGDTRRFCAAIKAEGADCIPVVSR